MRAVFFALALGSIAIASAFGCSSDDGTKGSSGSGGSGATDSGVGVGGCWPTSDTCYVAGPTGPGAECLAKKDNTGATKWQGRLSSIQVTKPDKLALDFMQTKIIDDGVNLNQIECNSKGKGTFNWFFEFDSATNKLKTGGGLPIGADPKAGGCFVTMTTLALPVAPIEVDVTHDGLSFSAKGIDVNVPIFLDPVDTTKAVVLPLHAVDFDGKFNDDTRNCIGRYRGSELSPDESCAGPAWETPGTIAGYITVAEADQVRIDLLQETLCVLLAGWSKLPNGDCATSESSTGTMPAGDWCTATNAPADAACKDAWRLQGTFAASGFQVNGDCP